MSNADLEAIWKEIESIARSDREFIDSLPDIEKLNNDYVKRYDAFLAEFPGRLISA